jgi:hypothetical protein
MGRKRFFDIWKRYFSDEIKIHQRFFRGRRTLGQYLKDTVDVHNKLVDDLTPYTKRLGIVSLFLSLVVLLASIYFRIYEGLLNDAMRFSFYFLMFLGTVSLLQSYKVNWNVLVFSTLLVVSLILIVHGYILFEVKSNIKNLENAMNIDKTYISWLSTSLYHIDEYLTGKSPNYTQITPLQRGVEWDNSYFENIAYGISYMVIGFILSVFSVYRLHKILSESKFPH